MPLDVATDCREFPAERPLPIGVGWHNYTDSDTRRAERDRGA